MCKSFDERVVLNRVSFSVVKGQTCVIMGRSGVGKSVSLKHVMGFLKPDSGRIFIDGDDVTDFSERQFAGIRRLVTMVFQSGALFDSLSVAENILFSLELRDDYNAEHKDEVVSSGPAIRRVTIPVRERIQSSLVFTSDSRALFVNTVGGT